MKSRSKQQGFTLLELIMVIGIMVVIAMIQFQEQTLRTEQQRARALGGELLQYNNAVRNYISYYSGVSGSSSYAGTKTGVNWLKSTSCGGQIPASVNKAGFIACEYLTDTGGLTTYGKMNFTTTITTPVPDQTMTAVTVMSELVLGKRSRGDLAGLAALVAAGASTIEGDPIQIVTDARVYYCLSETKSECAGNKSRIVMRVSSDSNNDTWLRTDGSNTMNNAIEFNEDTSSANREIRNVARIFNNNFEALTLGNNGRFASTASDVVVDADAEVIGALTVKDKVVAPYFVDKDDSRFVVDPNGTSTLNHVNLDGDLAAKGNITSDKDMRAKTFIDRDDETYYLDPNGLSRINAVTATAINGQSGKDDPGTLSINSTTVNFSNASGAQSAGAPVYLNGYADVDRLQVKTRNGSYVPLSAMLPDYVNLGSYQVVDGSQIVRPKCIANGIQGTPKIIVTPMNMTSHDEFRIQFKTGILRDQQYDISDYTSGRSYMGAEVSGDYWIVKAGTNAPDNIDDTPARKAIRAYGLATVYCTY